MSNPFTAIVSGLDKATSFLLGIFTKTSQVDAVFTKLAPATKAAMLATFYDVSKTVATASADVAAVASGNVASVITLSVQTEALVKGVVTDAELVGTDLKELGIEIKAAV